MNGCLPGLLAGLVAFPTSSPALAWSGVAQRIIYEIAFQELARTQR